MQPDDGLRPLRHAGDFVDIETAGVGGEDRAGFHNRVEPGKDVLLDVHAFEHRLDDEVAVGQAVETETPLQHAHPLFDVVHSEAAALGAGLVVSPHDAQAAVERFLLHFDDGYRNAGVEEIHRDAAAHRAGADDAHLLDRNERRVVRHVGNLVGDALGEEGIALRRRLGARHELDKQFALGLKPVFEGLIHRRLDATDVVFGRLEAAKLARVVFPEFIEDFRMAFRRLELGVVLANFFQRLALGHDAARERNRSFLQLAFRRELVDQPHGQAILGRNVLAARHHLQRLLDARDAGKALRAAGPGEQSQVNLRQPATRARYCDAVVCAKGDFKAATQSRAMDGRDHRLGRVFHHLLHVEQACAFLLSAELADVGAGDEGAALANQHDRLDR
jgi:hypothetical protein